MQRSYLEVTVDPDRTDAFVVVSEHVIQHHIRPLFGPALPRVVALRLTGETGAVVYVGCDTHHPLVSRQTGSASSAASARRLQLSRSLCTDLALREGGLVECVPLAHVPQATRVLVSPLTVDDSEVVEQNAARLEAELLRQVQLVFVEMTITVWAHRGVQARVRVNRVESACGGGGEVPVGMMFEGTHFVMATRVRRRDTPAAAASTPPRWTILRAYPSTQLCRGCATVRRGEADGYHTIHEEPSAPSNALRLCVHPAVARRFGWSQHMSLDALDLSVLSTLTEPTLSAAVRRRHVRRVRLCCCGAEESAEAEAAVPTRATVRWGRAASRDSPPALWQATNMLLAPHEDGAEAADGAGGDGVEGFAAPAHPLPPAGPTAAQLHEVHPRALCALRARLGAPAAVPHADSAPHILLTGATGAGKTALLAAALRERRRGGGHEFVAWVDCHGEAAAFVARLQSALYACRAAAPALLVLDGLDAVAPREEEGGAAVAVSERTRALWAAVLTRPLWPAYPTQTAGGAAAVRVIATAAHRTALHQSLCGAAVWGGGVVEVAPLTTRTRAALVRQVIAAAAAAAARGERAEEETASLRRVAAAAAAAMTNFTPLDVHHFLRRVAGEAAGGGGWERWWAAARPALAAFTPLAHTGIHFLRDAGEALPWNELAGLRAAKRALYDTLVLPMRHRRLFAHLPLKTRSGVLLYGPPGCGKTALLTSLVAAARLHCIVVNGPEVFGKYIGQSEQKIRDVFDRAAAAAPCVLFFDEFDAVAPPRGVDNTGVTDRVVNQLLCYLDGVEGRREVYVVAASSRPDRIDAALLRPGRLDRAVYCPLPETAERAAMLRMLLRRSGWVDERALRSATAEEDGVSGDVVGEVARATARWTPADLAALVSNANTRVSQRMLRAVAASRRGGGEEEEAAAAAAAAGVGDAAERTGFVVTALAAGEAEEKVSAALRAAAVGGGGGGKGSSDEATVRQKDDGRAAGGAGRLTRSDLMAALQTTRPSLSAKDVERHRGIHARFSRGQTIVPAHPGTAVTFG